MRDTYNDINLINECHVVIWDMFHNIHFKIK